MLLGLGIAVLLGHAKVDNVDNVSSLRPRPADEEVVRLDVTVDEVLLVDSLYTGQLGNVRYEGQRRDGLQTICFATMTTVLMENFRLQWSNRSSKLGPSRSMTRMLWRPSCPK